MISHGRQGTGRMWSSPDDVEIQVRYEVEHDVVDMPEDRRQGMLMWDKAHPYGEVRCASWVLFYWEDDTPTSGLETQWIATSALDVDDAVREAQRWLFDYRQLLEREAQEG